MFKKLKKVFSVYTTTWSFWIVVTVAGLLVAVVVPLVTRVKDYDRATPEPSAWTISIVKIKPVDPKTIERIESTDDRKAGSRAVDAQYLANLEVDWEQFDMNADGVRVQSLSDYDMWDRFAKMPHLKFLDLKYISFSRSKRYSKLSKAERSQRGVMVLEDLKNLKRISKLKSLRLPIANYEAEQLEILSELKGLHWLDISFGQLRNDLTSLPVLEDLEILHIRYSELLTEEGVAHLNSFPKLKTLIVSKLAFEEPAPEKMAELIAAQSQQIQGLTQIETIHLPHQLVYGPLAKPIASATLTVYPSEFDQTRNAISFFTFVTLLMLSAGLGLMLVIQFSRPESQLTPGYNEPHYSVAGILICIAIAGGVYTMTSVGVDFTVAIAVGFISVSFLSIFSCSPFVMPFAVLAFFGLIGAMLVLFPMNMAQIYLERFLVGLHPTATFIVGATGFLLTTVGIVRMRFIFHIYAKLGFSASVMNLAEPQKAQRIGQIPAEFKNNKFQTWIESWIYPPDVQYSKLFSKLKISKENRNYRVWKMAGGMTGKSMLYILAVMVIVIQLVFYFQYFLKGTLPPQSLQADIVMGVLIGIAPIYIAPLMGGSWYRRIPMLSHEFCLPISKSNLINNLCKGFLTDLKWLPFIPVIFTSPLVFLTHSFSESLTWIASYLAIAVGSTCLVYGVMLWTFQIREYWKLTLLYILETGFVMSVFIGLGFAAGGTFSWIRVMPAQSWFLTVAITVGVLGILFVRYARYRWNKLEFAKLV